MDELGKRKAIDSPRAERNASTSRQNKTRKLNPTDGSQDNFNQILSHDGPKGSDLTQKLVSMWLGGSKGQNSHLTQEEKITLARSLAEEEIFRGRSKGFECTFVSNPTTPGMMMHVIEKSYPGVIGSDTKVRESIALRESQQKCAEAEGLIQKIQQKVQNAETHIGDLTKELKLEKTTNSDLIEKINATAEMVSTITEHINYAIDALERCRHHKDHLSNLYDNIVLRQRAELEKLQIREQTSNKQMLDLQSEADALKEYLKDIRMSCDNRLKESDEKLASVVAECKVAQKQLEDVVKEKEELLRALSIKETYNQDFQKKISEYEVEFKNLSSQLAKVSASFEIVEEANLRLQNDLTSKNNEMLKLVEDLDSAKEKHTEEISSMKNMNLELEEKLKNESSVGESLRKKLNDITVLKNELNRQVEQLKDDTSAGMTEMKRRLDNAEMETERVREEGKKVICEMAKRDESHVEKYESLLAEMKALEARHHSEVSRVTLSSNTAISSANIDKSRLMSQLDSLKRENEEYVIKLRQVEDLLLKHTNSEMELKRKVEQYEREVVELETRHESELKRVSLSSSNVLSSANADRSQMESQLDSLRREKEEREIELRRVKDLLKKHGNSELQLKRKLEQYKSEAAALASSAVAAAEHKKSQDIENQENVRKISALEKELLKLQCNQTETIPSEIQQTQAIGETELLGKEPSARKTSAALTYQKSILKRATKPRKVRSSPPSPVLPTNKKISFMDLDSSSDASPVKLVNTSNIDSFLNSKDTDDDVVDTGKSFSQPSQVYQNKSQSLSQSQSSGKKFFKSRYSKTT